MKMTTIGRAFRSALMIGVAFASGGALAADQIEEIVVTGSRIPVTSLTSVSPLSVSSAADIEMTNAFGLEDVLQKMVGPDSTGGTTNNSNNGGVGASQIGLRNLGPSRTLVLIDGQRLVPIYGSTFSAPDLNAVPLAMTERIEVLRDGASSIYGADAIGGVINIITKKDFEGFQLDASGGLSQHGGGGTHSISGVAGFNTDKGNITFALLHEKENFVGQWQRDWATDVHASDPNFPFGSAYRSQLDVLQDSGSSTVWVGGVPRTLSDATLATQVPCLAYSPVAGRVKLNAGCNTSQGGWNTLNSALERNQATVVAHYAVTDTVKLIMQGNYTERRSAQNLRPEPLLGSAIATVNFTDGGTIFPGFVVPASAHWGYTSGGTKVTCPDPAGCIDAFLTPIQFGPRAYRQTSDTFRVRTGLEGEIFTNYKWEVGFVGQRNETTQLIYNSGNWQHLAQMTGLLPCVDVPGGCTSGAPFGYTYAVPTTPVNFYAGPNMLSAVQKAYLTYTNDDKSTADQNYIYGDINGPLFPLPAGDVQAAIGFEHRTEHLSQVPDSLEVAGYAANHTGPTSGGYKTDSQYAELRIPILKDQAVAKELNVTPSVRHDHNSQFGNATTWKVGADYQVIDQIRLRGTYATGFRAPSVSELYNANGVSFVSVSGDPCDSRSVINGNSNMGQASLASGSTCFAALTALGLTPAQIATYRSPQNALSNDQRGFVIGGNPNIQPEKSKQWNLGFVVTPFTGLTATMDYYKITVNNAIADGGIALSGSPDAVPLGCYVQQIQQFCNLITRNATSGIFQISSQNTNFGVVHSRGIDFEIAYASEFNELGVKLPGSFSVDLQVNHEIQNDQLNPDATITNYVGFFNYGNESIQPKWKGIVRVDYVLNGLRAHWDMSYIQGTEDLGGVNHVYGGYIPDYFYHNISMSYDLSELVSNHVGVLDSTKIILGVNNVFDKDPPFLGADSICKCNSLAGPYDFIGRFFYAKLALKL